MNVRTLISGLGIASALVAGPALARPDETRGFPLGEKSRIHTALDMGVGYDSNPVSAPSAAVVDDWKAHFLPSVSVDVPGSSVSLTGRAQLTIEQFFGTNSGKAADTYFGGQLALSFSAGSDESVVGLEVRESLIRTPTFVGAADGGIGALGAEQIGLVQWYNRGEANIVLRPGGGALEFRLGYGNELRLFDSSSEAQKHMAKLQAKLRFLPKTAAVFDADFGFYSELSGGNTGDVYRGNPFNISVGLLGQLTTAISVIARIGFGDTLSYQQNQDFFGTANEGSIRSLIANARVQYTFGNGSSVALGYDRTVRNAIAVGGGFVSDSPYAKIEILVGDRFTFSTVGRLEFRTFGGTNDVTGQVYSADVRADYWFFDFLRGGAAYQVLATDGAGTFGGNTPVPVAARHQILLTTGLYY